MGQKITAIIAIILILIIGGCGYWLYRNYAPTEVKDAPNTSMSGIIKYELQTHEYFDGKPQNARYRISTEDDLTSFYAIYSDKLNANVEYLKSNDLFIEVRTEGSGSTKNTLSDVTIENNKLEFIIDTDTPEVGTTDMAFWYFVAVIPKDKLTNLDLSDWKNPSNLQ